MFQTNRRRYGFSLTEVMVCASLLLAVMSFVASISLRTHRIWKDIRLQKIALDEMSNQMESLTALSPDQLEQAIASLEISADLKQSMPLASLTGEVIQLEDSTQIELTLRIDGDQPQGPAKSHPLTLVGFLSPEPGVGS